MALARPQRMFAQERETVLHGVAGDVIGAAPLPGAQAIVHCFMRRSRRLSHISNMSGAPYMEPKASCATLPDATWHTRAVHGNGCSGSACTVPLCSSAASIGSTGFLFLHTKVCGPRLCQRTYKDTRLNRRIHLYKSSQLLQCRAQT